MDSASRAPRRLTINLTFPIGSREGLDDGVKDLLSQVAAEDGQEEKKGEIIAYSDISVKDSLALIKASPIGTTITVNYDRVEGSEQGCHKTTYYDEVVETKTVDTGTTKGRVDATRRMSIGMASRRMSIGMDSRRMSIDMSIESTDEVDSDLEDILLNLYDAAEWDEESTGGTSVGDIMPGLALMGLRRDSLSLVKKRKALRRKSSGNKSFADVPEEEEEDAGNFVVGTKKG